MIFIHDGPRRLAFCALAFVALGQWAFTAVAQEEMVTARIGLTSATETEAFQAAKVAAAYAVEEANDRDLHINGKKLKFELVIQNDKNDANLARPIAQYFIRNQVVGVIGPWNSDAGLATAKLYSDAHIPMIFPTISSTPSLPSGIGNVFAPAGDPGEAAQFYAGIAVDQLRVEKMAIIDDRTSFGTNFADRFVDMLVQRGAQITSRESVSTRTSDFNAVLATVTRVKPDTVLFTGDATQSVAIMRAMERQNMNFRVLLIGGAVNTEQLKEKVKVPLFSIESGIPLDKNTAWKKLQKAYKDKHGGALDANGRFGYDAVNLLAAAVQKANSIAPADVGAALYNSRLGASSRTISFDSKGKLQHALYTVYQYKDAQWLAVKSSGEPER
ncbi:branched-chain amino acid ABC transporter substrate-binding protein [Herbaspirillum sp. RV1423]|uniref:branched-chain amino acid ABC transporter substrate-binding protein n=1 Tax=Herbaspirillum sp. RV1423 TaxID=1443993 RepID=UPI0004B54390|nr:branched-chain amino acid ABC transporter substrate-binding protein [Herbaspirillum sp. RV1423]